MNRPTKKQKAIIHIAAQDLGLARDDYENLLEAEFGVRSSNDLTAEQADRLIRHLYRNRNGSSRRAAPPQTKQPVKLERADAPADPNAPVSPAQQGVIEGLRAFAGITPPGLRKIAWRVCKEPWPQTQGDAQKMIYAMTSMLAQDLLGAVENLGMPESPVTRWERGFLFDNELNARDELRRVAAAKGKRGQRSMPRLSMTKLVEIVNKYKINVRLKL